MHATGRRVPRIDSRPRGGFLFLMDLGLTAAFCGIGLTAYGAGLATFKVVTERRPKVKVRLNWAVMGAGNPTTILSIKVANAGHRPVTLVNHAFRLPDGNSLVDLQQHLHREHPFPHELTPGNKCWIWMEMNKFIATARQNGYSGTMPIVAFVEDGLGNEYESKPMQVDTNAEY